TPNRGSGLWLSRARPPALHEGDRDRWRLALRIAGGQDLDHRLRHLDRHVYHWHLVTAAMQMTMFNTLPTDHPIYQLLAPQSKYAIPFADVLLLLWAYIAPPTSISTPFQFLELANGYGAGRSYFDDDPKTTLASLGLVEADFTLKTPW